MNPENARPTGTPSRARGDSTPCPPAERRARRAEVERRLIDGQRTRTIMGEVSKAFGVSPWTVRMDVRAVERRWRAEDGAALDRMRRETALRLRRVAVAAERDGDLKTATNANAALSKALGMGGPAVTVDARSVTVAPGAVPLPDAAQLDRVAAILGDARAAQRVRSGAPPPALEDAERGALDAADDLLGALGGAPPLPRPTAPVARARPALPAGDVEADRPVEAVVPPSTTPPRWTRDDDVIDVEPVRRPPLTEDERRWAEIERSKGRPPTLGDIFGGGR